MSWQATAWAERQVTGSPARKVLLLVLANYADEHGICWPSQSTLSEGTEQSTDTVQRQLRKLQELGIISIERRPKQRGQWQGFVYKLHLHTDHSTRPQSAARTSSRMSSAKTTVDAAENVDVGGLDLRPGRAATSTSTGPQSLRHKPSIEPSSEPSAQNTAGAAADRLRAFQAKHEGLEVVQNRIAQRLGSDGWLILGGMSDAQRAKLTALERKGKLDDAALSNARLAARCARPP